MSTTTTYTTASGVTYTVTDTSYGLGLNNYDVEITASDGTVLLNAANINRGIDILGIIDLAASGDVITGSGNSAVLVNLASVGTYVSVPGATGSFVIGAGALSANTYYIGGTTTISGLANLITGSTINVAGGTATLSGGSGGSVLGALNGSTVTIEYGGTFNTGAALASVLEGATVSFGTGGGTLVINGGGTAVSLLSSGDLAATTIQNYDPSQDTIELQDTVAAISGYTISGDTTKTITLFGSGGTPVATYNVTPASGVSLTDGTYNSVNSAEDNPLSITYANGNTYVGVCFLADSMIRTASGDVAVQDIRVGDEVMARINGEEQVRTVVWAGRKHATVRPGLPEDEAGYPVRILKDAIAEGVPYKDMLITPEHCLFLDGAFIPARMLVNNRSVFHDRSITEYDYYHIETETHSVIMADGVLTESYLDTGNRGTFLQEGSVVSIGARKTRSWANDAAAPLTVARDIVEPIFRRIAARAEDACVESAVASPVLTGDAGLHLVTGQGRTLRRARDANGHAIFMIPPDVDTVSIVSRTSRPSDTIGPFLDDRRHLGVLIGTITLFDSADTRRIDAHLTAPRHTGWDVRESAPCRWTNGDAVLQLGTRRPDSVALLAIQILAGGPYPVSADTGETALRSA
jgi:Hint domain